VLEETKTGAKNSRLDVLAVILHRIADFPRQAELFSDVGKFRFQFFHQLGFPLRFTFQEIPQGIAVARPFFEILGDQGSGLLPNPDAN
jgi:hypothetical protein